MCWLQGDFLIARCPQRTAAAVRLNLLWICNKYADLVDTGIFVLRGKHAQLTFLHVYHHTVVIYYAYMSFVETPGGYQLLTGTMNSLVHMVMYAYYLAAIADAEWVAGWAGAYKRRITQLQMVQFVANVLNFGSAALGRCAFPAYLAWSGAVQNAILLGLFGQFYWRAYVAKKRDGEGRSKRKRAVA